MKIKEGGRYLNKRGDHLGPMTTPPNNPLSLFLDQYGTPYHLDGTQWNHVPESTGNISDRCPECDGAGEWDEGPINYGGFDPVYRQVTCSECRGTGKVS